jgi:hypothetical protein
MRMETNKIALGRNRVVSMDPVRRRRRHPSPTRAILFQFPARSLPPSLALAPATSAANESR